MKKLFISMLLILGLSLPCWAGSPVTFQWDPNLESDLAGYRLYQTTIKGEYTFGEENAVAITPAGTETCRLPDVSDGTYWWVLSAFDTFNNESGRSNEVTAILDATAPDPPIVLVIPIIADTVEINVNCKVASKVNDNAKF